MLETIAIVKCKLMSCDSFKKKITYKVFTYKSYMYIHLNVSKQMTDVKLLKHLTLWKQIVNSNRIIRVR